MSHVLVDEKVAALGVDGEESRDRLTSIRPRGAMRGFLRLAQKLSSESSGSIATSLAASRDSLRRGSTPAVLIKDANVVSLPPEQPQNGLKGGPRACRTVDDFGDASPRGHGKLHGPFPGLHHRGRKRPLNAPKETPTPNTHRRGGGRQHACWRQAPAPKFALSVRSWSIDTKVRPTTGRRVARRARTRRVASEGSMIQDKHMAAVKDAAKALREVKSRLNGINSELEEAQAVLPERRWPGRLTTTYRKPWWRSTAPRTALTPCCATLPKSPAGASLTSVPSRRPCLRPVELDRSA